jgi:hypothetical protein
VSPVIPDDASPLKIRVKEYTVEVMNDKLEATSFVKVAEVAAEDMGSDV